MLRLMAHHRQQQNLPRPVPLVGEAATGAADSKGVAEPPQQPCALTQPRHALGTWLAAGRPPRRAAAGGLPAARRRAVGCGPHGRRLRGWGPGLARANRQETGQRLRVQLCRLVVPSQAGQTPVGRCTWVRGAAAGAAAAPGAAPRSPIAAAARIDAVWGLSEWGGGLSQGLQAELGGSKQEMGAGRAAATGAPCWRPGLLARTVLWPKQRHRVACGGGQRSHLHPLASSASGRQPPGRPVPRLQPPSP